MSALGECVGEEKPFLNNSSFQGQEGVQKVYWKKMQHCCSTSTNFGNSTETSFDSETSEKAVQTARCAVLCCSILEKKVANTSKGDSGLYGVVSNTDYIKFNLVFLTY